MFAGGGSAAEVYSMFSSVGIKCLSHVEALSHPFA